MELIHEQNRIFACDDSGKAVIAEITFPAVTDGKVNINHTYVDPAFRGRGVAGELVQAAADDARRNNLKVKATCSYAQKWFQTHPQYLDLYEA